MLQPQDLLPPLMRVYFGEKAVCSFLLCYSLESLNKKDCPLLSLPGSVEQVTTSASEMA